MLVIHIGPRKTATTYLQANFYRNRKELLAKGWLYPIVALRAQNAHHQVVSSRDAVLAGEGALFKRLKRAADEAARKGVNMLLSSEGFRKWAPKDFVKLGKLLGQDEVMIAYTLRDPMTMLVSLWGETVKNGRTASLPKYAAKQLREPSKSEALNPLRELEPILNHSKLRLAVLDYEAVRRENGDIYTAFCRHVLGLEGMLPSREKPANFSFPIELSDYIRKLSEHVGHEPKKSDIMFSRLFTACHSAAEIDAIVNTIREKGVDARETLRLDRDAEWYRAIEADVIAKLGRRLHPLPEGGRLFTGGAREIVSYDMDRLAENPAIRALLDASAEKLKSGRVPWSRTRLMRIWRYIQRFLGL